MFNLDLTPIVVFLNKYTFYNIEEEVMTVRFDVFVAIYTIGYAGLAALALYQLSLSTSPSPSNLGREKSLSCCPRSG